MRWPSSGAAHRGRHRVTAIWQVGADAWRLGARGDTHIFRDLGRDIRGGRTGFTASAVTPSGSTYAIFILVVPVPTSITPAWSSAAVEEAVDRGDVPFSVLWSGLATVLAYGIPILAILIALPVS